LQPLFDGRKGYSLGEHQNQLGTENKSGWQGPRLRDFAQIGALLFG